MAPHSIPIPYSQQAIQRIFSKTTTSLIRSSTNFPILPSLYPALPCNKHGTTTPNVQSYSSLSNGSATSTSLRRHLHLPTTATRACQRTPLLALCWPSLFPRGIDPFRSWNRLKASAVLYTLATPSPSSSASSSSPSTRPAIMGSIPDSSAPVRIFIAGGSYAGLSACFNLLDLAAGRNPRMSGDEYPHVDDYKTMNLEITIADERDGFCTFPLLGRLYVTKKEALLIVYNTRKRSPHRLASSARRCRICQKGLGQILRHSCPPATAQCQSRHRLRHGRRLRGQDGHHARHSNQASHGAQL